MWQSLQLHTRADNRSDRQQFTAVNGTAKIHSNITIQTTPVSQVVFSFQASRLNFGISTILLRGHVQ
jgi:hypothetical protein